MKGFLLRRTLGAIAVMWVVATLVFVMLRLVPGNISDILFDSAGFVDPAEKARLEAELGGADGAGIRVNGPEDAAYRLPNTLSVGVAGISASALLESLSEEVAASAGAACHTGEAAATVSGVLRAMRVPDEYAVGTLRLSVGRHTTVEDVEIGAEKIIAAAKAQRDEIAALPEGERPWWCVRNVAKAFK